MNKLYILLCVFIVSAFAVGCGSNGPADFNVTAHAAQPITEDIKDSKLAVFKTEFKGATDARAHNITKASESIDQKIIEPGEIFSFNESIGPTTKARGYMLGRIFVNGKDAKGYGGGVCQVSSTLFNAAQQAGLDIIERHTHSKPVGYVEKGQDAATSYGVKDLKFANNTPFVIRINSGVADNTLTVELESV